MPFLYVIAGCNGAGKTTASYTMLREILNCKEFVNADEIAKGLSPFSSSTNSPALIAMNNGSDFVVENHDIWNSIERE